MNLSAEETHKAVEAAEMERVAGRAAVEQAQSLTDLEKLMERWIGHRDHGCEDVEAVKEFLHGYLDEVYYAACEVVGS